MRPLAAISTLGAAIAGRTMARVKHYKRVAIAGSIVATLAAAAMTLTTPSLWVLLLLLSVFGIGLHMAVNAVQRRVVFWMDSATDRVMGA